MEAPTVARTNRTPQAGGSSRPGWTIVPAALILIAALYYLGSAIVTVALNLDFPYQLDWIEGPVYASVLRIAAGLPVYAPPNLAALDAAIDEDVQAALWLKKNNHPVLLIFSEACRANQSAIKWLMNNNLEAFVSMAQEIKYLRDNTTFDYHKKKF